MINMNNYSEKYERQRGGRLVKPCLSYSPINAFLYQNMRLSTQKLYPNSIQSKKENHDETKYVLATIQKEGEAYPDIKAIPLDEITPILHMAVTPSDVVSENKLMLNQQSSHSFKLVSSKKKPTNQTSSV